MMPYKTIVVGRFGTRCGANWFYVAVVDRDGFTESDFKGAKGYSGSDAAWADARTRLRNDEGQEVIEADFYPTINE